MVTMEKIGPRGQFKETYLVVICTDHSCPKTRSLQTFLSRRLLTGVTATLSLKSWMILWKPLPTTPQLSELETLSRFAYSASNLYNSPIRRGGGIWYPRTA